MQDSNTESVKAFFDQHAAAYAESETHRQGNDLQGLVEWLPLTSTCKVLDAATGPGHAAFTLAPHVAEVIGLDLTPGMQAQFEKKASQSPYGNRTRFQIGDVHQIPFPDQTFDIVVCRRAAHHFHDPLRAMQEFARVLNPGGHCAIIDMTTLDDPLLNATVNALEIARDDSHQRALMPSEWLALAEQASMEVIRDERWEQAFPWHTWLRPVSMTGSESQVLEIILRNTPDHLKQQVVIEQEGKRHFLKRFIFMITRRKN